MAPKPCLGGCGGFATRGPRCDACTAGRQRTTDARRGTTAQRGYDSAWRAIRADAIRHQPWCTDCRHTGSPDNPLTGDHLRWPARTRDDVDVVCRVCNSRRRRAGRMRNRLRRR